MTHQIPQAIADAVATWWRRRDPRPDNLFETPEFVGLKNACLASYSVGAAFWFTSSLWEILRSLGCPMLLPNDKQDLALDADAAAERLHLALTATTSRVVHLCPLDWADQPPPVAFAGSRLNRFTSNELQEIVDAPRLARAFLNAQPDWNRLSEFYWLIVEEAHSIAVEPGARTNPIMFETTQDYGAITAHEDRFPSAVEQALFLLLLAPWEDWSEAMEVDWRGFRIPWVYMVNGDLCVRLTSPPLDSNLTWVPQTYTDAYGELIEVEEPAHFNLSEDAAALTDYANDQRWSDLCRAAGSPLFETPIRHFLVRAFHSAGIDEFIAHLTVLEAALGLQSDYGPKAAGDPRKGRKVTEIMMGRVARLLDDSGAGEEFKALFDLRSAYVRGRPMVPISGVDRFRARRLARRVVVYREQVLVVGVENVLERTSHAFPGRRRPEVPRQPQQTVGVSVVKVLALNDDRNLGRSKLDFDDDREPVMYRAHVGPAPTIFGDQILVDYHAVGISPSIIAQQFSDRGLDRGM